MTSTNDIACSDNPNPQFVIIFVHCFMRNVDLAESSGPCAS
jgi:hypothetical protein